MSLPSDRPVEPEEHISCHVCLSQGKQRCRCPHVKPAATKVDLEELRERLKQPRVDYRLRRDVLFLIEEATRFRAAPGVEPAAPRDQEAPQQDTDRWRGLYRALAWMVNDYIGICGISADFDKKDDRLGYAHEGYHNARIVLRGNKPPVPERLRRFNEGTACLSGGNQHPDRCECQEKETGRFAGTPHKHYGEPPYACARCKCRAYKPALGPPAVCGAAHHQEPK